MARNSNSAGRERVKVGERVKGERVKWRPSWKIMTLTKKGEKREKTTKSEKREKTTKSSLAPRSRHDPEGGQDYGRISI